MTGHWLWLAIPILLVVAGYLYRRVGEARDNHRFPPPGEMVDVGGRGVHMIRKGAGGPTVVFEPGAGASSSMWWPFQDRLTDVATVVYDRAGLGWSDAAPSPRTMEDRAIDLHALLVAAGIPPPYVLVGHSYGGPLIRLFARDHPNEVAGMVFVDIGHEAVFSTAGAQRYLNRMITIVRVMGVAAQVGLLRLLGFRGLPEPSTALALTPAQKQAAGSRAARPGGFRVAIEEFASVKRIAEAMLGLDTPGLLGDTPVAVLSHGIPFPGSFAVLEVNHEEGQKQLAALSTNSVFIVAEKSSHAIPWDEPEVVLDAIRRVVIAARNHARLEDRIPGTSIIR